MSVNIREIKTSPQLSVIPDPYADWLLCPLLLVETALLAYFRVRTDKMLKCDAPVQNYAKVGRCVFISEPLKKIPISVTITTCQQRLSIPPEVN